MGAAERVVHVDVGERGELLGEGGIVLFLGGVEAQVLEQEHAAGRERGDGLGRRPGPTQSSAKATGAQRRAASASATGRRLMSGTRLPSGRPRCDIRMTFAPFLRRYLMVGSDSLEALVALDLAVLEGDVEVDAHDDALGGDGEGFDEELGHGRAGLAGGGAGCRLAERSGFRFGRRRSRARAAIGLDSLQCSDPSGIRTFPGRLDHNRGTTRTCILCRGVPGGSGRCLQSVSYRADPCLGAPIHGVVQPRGNSAGGSDT